MSKIFFVCYGGGHARMLLPIIREAKVHNHDIVLLALTSAQDFYKNNSINYKTLSNYKKEICDFSINQYVYDLHSIDEYKLMGSDIDETLLYYSLSISDYLKNNNNDYKKLKFNYKMAGRVIFLPVESSKKILEYENPDIVITTNSPRFEQAMIIACNQLKIKCISIADLFGELPFPVLKNQNYLNIKDYNIFADITCVMSNQVIDNYLLRGANINKLKITGQPGFSYLERIKSKVFNAKNTRILFAAQIRRYEQDIVKFLFENQNKIEGKIDIKLHPNSSKAIREGFENYQGNITFVDDEMSSIINLYDIIITVDSTVGIEGILLNKEIVILDLDAEFNIYRNCKACHVISSLYDLPIKISNIIHDKNLREKYQKERLSYSVKGNVIENIINLI